MLPAPLRSMSPAASILRPTMICACACSSAFASRRKAVPLMIMCGGQRLFLACTRAWCRPLEMGIGTVTVRVMFDELRADDDGFPSYEDLAGGYGLHRQRAAGCGKGFLGAVRRSDNASSAYINDLTPDTPRSAPRSRSASRKCCSIMRRQARRYTPRWKYQAIYEHARRALVCHGHCAR